MIYILILIVFAFLIIMYLKFNMKLSNEKFVINDAILNHDELIAHAGVVAKGHVISQKKKNYDFLFSRLDENYKFILTVYKRLNDDAKKHVSLCPASEWLLDNFYIIEEQYKDLKLSIDSNFYKKLNIIDKGPLKGYPRVFAVGLELVSHADGRIDENQFVEFVESYQSVSLLKMAEIWALFPMLKISLLEKIRYVCEKVIATQIEWEKVDKIKDNPTNEVITKCIEYIGSMKSLNSSYIEHLISTAKKEEFNSEALMDKINSKLIEFDSDIQKVINFEHQEQAGLQVTMGNCITSLRMVNALDWDEVFEKLSMVEKIMKSDPAGIYTSQDFETRDYYRHQVELLSHSLKISETKIARSAVYCAQKAQDTGNELKLAHIGYYIIGDGRYRLLSLLNNKDLKGAVNKNKQYKYILSIIIISTLIPVLFLLYSYRIQSNPNIFLMIAAGFIFWIPSSEIVINIANKIITKSIPASFLPKLEYSNEIPFDQSTMVIVPTLIPSSKRAEELIDHLEVTYLANNEKNIYFAIVGDLKDADNKNNDEDTKIINGSIVKIKELNKKYSPDSDIFFFFMRERTFCEKEKRWMGWERKRGAIVEFNNLIKGSAQTSYNIISGNVEPLKNIKYVITLDADTILPIGCAKKLIGTISHPINKANFDKSRGIVTKGYGLIQPRIGLNIISANKSLFSRIFAGQGGIDSYTNAVSDIYQDLFGEAIFTGKGIYDIDIFRDALNEAIPDNTVLSHDLLEGSYLRVGLATDIMLIDSYPEKYSSYMMRLHRWVRGDWQLISWLFPFINNRKGKKVKNPLSPISKWKIFDNLRRSLVSICLMLIFVIGILFLPENITLWIGFAFLTIFLPLITGFFEYAKFRNYRSVKERLNGNLIYGLKCTFYETLLILIFLPYHAYVMCTAIIKTLYRVFISRKNMLEWVTAADVEKNIKNNLRSFIMRMYPPLVILYIITILNIVYNSRNVIYSLALAIIWSFCPFTAYVISKPNKEKEITLKQETIDILKRISRKTWYFYENFSGAEDNFLPPDNYQVTPVKRIAHRTSPTNIGFLLIAILSALDLGYLSIPGMVKKLYNLMQTLDKLEKWNGHLYNWYDTKSLKILKPRYVSTVDSGNLIGYMITLKQGLNDILDAPIMSLKLADGLMDTISLSPETEDDKKDIIKKFIADQEFDIIKFYEAVNNLLMLSYNKDSGSWDLVVLNDLNTLKREIEAYFPFVNFEYDMIELIEKSHLGNSYKDFIDSVKRNPSINNIKALYEGMVSDLESSLCEGKINKYDQKLFMLIKNTILDGYKNIINLIDEVEYTQKAADDFIHNTSFAKLYDEKMGLFSIGYNIDENRLTNSYYDLLASESRITSYLAVVNREVPVSHWFRLGRSLALIDGYKGLVSWTGTMFEYFMPPLIMNVFGNTLLDETYKTVLKAQIKYGRGRNVPWGTSESGFYTFDLMLNYQYKAFGVPELGLKRGLINDMVVSPYSTVLGLPFSPEECESNISALVSHGLEGDYGFYEAIDYTPDRLPNNSDKAIVESFMAHHQGMILIALNNFFNKNIMVKRFHANPIIKTGEYLLQERIPLRVLITKEHKELITPLEKIEYFVPMVIRRIENVNTEIPECHMLSNGSYTMMITSRGNGYSKKDGLYVTRWREDISSKNYGFFVFLRNISNNYSWASTYEPFKTSPIKYEAKFSPDKAEFFRTDESIETHTEICISPEDNCEIRRITLSNNGEDAVIIECTSYFEIVIANLMADIAHPAFNNLFIRTEAFKELNSLIASRRPREESGKTMFAYNTMSIQGESIGELEYETDRYKFIGRGRDITNCTALGHPLTNSTGAILDPIMSLRRKVKIEPGKHVTVSYIIGISESKENAIELCRKYNEYSNILREFELAYIRSQMSSKYLNLKNSDIECFDSMISSIIFLNPLRRKYDKYIMQNKKGQSGLWSHGVSGDIPIVLVTIKDADDIDMVRDMIKAHEYWRTKNLRIDMIILNEDESNYYEPIQNLIRDMVLSSNARDVLENTGGIFIKNSKLLSEDDVTLFYTAARLIIKAENGRIKSQIRNSITDVNVVPRKEFTGEKISYSQHYDEPLNLLFFNDYGGFGPDGSNYIIRLKAGINTPAPWSNVISNRRFGFTITENGSGYTWSQNSRENKLTEWTNDPVSDTPSEVLYIRNNSSGETWNITPLPVRENDSYKITHGMGYSSFEHFSHGIEQTLNAYVPITDETVKISFIKLKNTTEITQDLSIYYYIKPVLGVSPQVTQQYLVTDYMESSDILLIRNPYNSDFPGRISFLDTSLKKDSFTGDRKEFIGLNGSLSNPEALTKEALSGSVGACFYPCLAFESKIKLLPYQEMEFVVLLGEGDNIEEALSLSSKYKNLEECSKAFADVSKFWKKTLGTITVKTPDLSMDFMLNYWLLYQTTACRLWARTAFYQSGGAFGFRDQLQDVLSLINILPKAAREQILLHCAHQFVEGDVLHWWHPASVEKGIRTKFSDDLLWLPFVTIEYLEKTGDQSILYEEANYVEDDLLRENEDERYGVPRKSEEKSNVYEHCIRALERSLKFGEHGIPLMGSGDWNDGMSTVGNKGKGESVWMGWFLCTILKGFAPICKLMNDDERSEKYLNISAEIAEALEKNAWDGQWYRRAYFDDGTPLGSSINNECKIDSLAQSWAVISEFGNEDRTKSAMQSLEDYLIRRDDGLILLFTPPFDNGDLKPGYIKGYVPGVRENGGQYTHGATWVIYAFAKMGYGDKAFELFKLINPIIHTMTQFECARYKVEPYVMAADVYAVDPNTGRGGWTWYTGSAGWMYKAGLEEILGFKKKDNILYISPCIPGDWREYTIKYKYFNTVYNITVRNPNNVSAGVKQVLIDGIDLERKYVELANSGVDHSVEVILG